MLEQSLSLFPFIVQLNNDQLFNNQPDWLFDEQHGWRRDKHIIDQDDFYTEKSTLRFNANRLRRLRKISGVFSSYFNTPSNGLGTNYLRINFTDSTYVDIGTSDNHSSPNFGLRVDDGITGYYSSVDIFNLFIEFIIPTDKVVSSIGFVSNGYTDEYPITLRGFKDIILTFE